MSPIHLSKRGRFLSAAGSPPGFNTLRPLCWHPAIAGDSPRVRRRDRPKLRTVRRPSTCLPANSVPSRSRPWALTNSLSKEKPSAISVSPMTYRFRSSRRTRALSSTPLWNSARTCSREPSPTRNYPRLSSRRAKPQPAIRRTGTRYSPKGGRRAIRKSENGRIEDLPRRLPVAVFGGRHLHNPLKNTAEISRIRVAAAPRNLF